MTRPTVLVTTAHGRQTAQKLKHSWKLETMSQFRQVEPCCGHTIRLWAEPHSCPGDLTDRTVRMTLTKNDIKTK